MTSIRPSCGIEDGGTVVTIVGRNLDIGSGASIIVAGSLCAINSSPTNEMVCCDILVCKTYMSICYICSGDINIPNMKYTPVKENILEKKGRLLFPIIL